MTDSLASAAACSVTPALLSVWRFLALNTEIKLFASDWTCSAAFPRAEQVFHDEEARLSRFRPSSELSLLNATTGRDVRVSSELFDLLERCLLYYRQSGGTFDPAVLTDLEAAGYDRSFELMLREAEAPPMPPPGRPVSFGEVRLDRRRRTVRLAKGVRVDLGGIGKGYIVDRAAAVFAPVRNFLIDAGGDIYASGEGGEGPGWLVGVADPRQEGNHLTTIWLRDQALATSTTTRRTWRRSGRLLNHLIDPRTREPVENGVIAASVVASTATDADGFAKVALLKGLESGTRFLDGQRAGGLFVFEDGTWSTTKYWSGGRS